MNDANPDGTENRIPAHLYQAAAFSRQGRLAEAEESLRRALAAASKPDKPRTVQSGHRARGARALLRSL